MIPKKTPFTRRQRKARFAASCLVQHEALKEFKGTKQWAAAAHHAAVRRIAGAQPQ
jgi:hypothetical protein